MSSNQSDCGTLRSTSTLRSKANSSVYNASRSEYETATIKRSHSQSHRNSSLIAGSSTLMRADLDSDQLFTWNWRKNGHLRVISRVFLQKNTLEFAKETFIYHQCEKLTSKRHEETYMECCAMFLFTLYITELPWTTNWYSNCEETIKVWFLLPILGSKEINTVRD